MKAIYLMLVLVLCTGFAGVVQEDRILALERKLSAMTADVEWLKQQMMLRNDDLETVYGNADADNDLSVMVKLRKHLEQCCGPMEVP